MAERNAKTGVKDLVLDASRRGIVEVGYDGSDEPTYSFRPVRKLVTSKDPVDRWSSRGDVAARILVEARDPATGAVQKGKSGGLKAMQDVFGEAVCVKGLTDELGGDSEYVHHLRRLNAKALMWGLPDEPITTVHGYKGSVMMVGKSMSPTANSAPEMYWMDGYLRLNEGSDAPIHVVPAHAGVEALQKVVEKVDRGRVRIVHVELTDQKMYLSDFYNKGTLYPPIKVAYEHPDHPKLAEEALADPQQLKEASGRQDALMRWFAGAFAQANAGSRFVSSTELVKMSPSNVGESVSVAELQKAVDAMAKEWGTNTHPPDYLTVNNGQYLSLAETFQVLCDALAEQNRTGKLPKTVQIRPVYGPITMPDEHGPATGTVTRAAVARVGSQLAAQIDDATWKPVPVNAVPGWVNIDSTRVTGGQFLHLMAEALVAPTPDTKLSIKMSYLFTASGFAYPKMRMPIDQGGTWTFKPAPLHLPGGARAETASPIPAGR